MKKSEKRYNNPFLTIKKKGKLEGIDIVFTMGFFWLLVFIGFVIGILIRIGGGLFIEFPQSEIKQCTKSQEVQEIRGLLESK